MNNMGVIGRFKLPKIGHVILPMHFGHDRHTEFPQMLTADTISFRRQEAANTKLEKWFPLQGEQGRSS